MVTQLKHGCDVAGGAGPVRADVCVCARSLSAAPDGGAQPGPVVTSYRGQW